MENNRLTGEIPEALGNMSQLHWLDLSNNKLTGPIPVSLNKISYLDLSNNELLYAHSHNTTIGTSCNTTIGRNRITTTGKTHSAILMKVLGALGSAAVLIMCYMVLGVVKKILHNREEFKQTIREILQKSEHPRISYEELLAATDRFNSSNLIATNNFGSVYKGFFPDGTHVVVKVLNLMHEQSEKLFRAECKVLQRALSPLAVGDTWIEEETQGPWCLPLPWIEGALPIHSPRTPWL